MFWTYGTTPTLLEIAEIAKIAGGKMALAKIGAAGTAAFGAVGWPLIGAAGLGYLSYRLFKVAGRVADQATFDR
jgi:hypothetical protein